MSRIRHKLSKKGVPPKPSFVSYLNSGVKEQSEDEQSLDELSLDDDIGSPSSSVLLENASYLADDMFEQLKPSYLPGEVMVSRADRVVRYIPYSDFHQGLVGSLFVTEFRIMFLPVQNNEGIKVHNPFWRNKLYNENDIILNNILGVYQVSKGKRKKLVTGKLGSRSIVKIEIECKDFRLHQFSFENVKAQETSVVINAITHFAFPDKIDRLFAFTYKGDTHPDEKSTSLPDFSTRASWEAELKRLAASKLFKVIDNNEAFKESRTMPRYFVVPSVVTNESLRKDLQLYEDYRVPVWSYTYKNGASIIRMTFPIVSFPEKDTVEYEFEKRLQQIHPEKKKPMIFDIHEPILVSSKHAGDERIKLPSLKELKQSYNKLRELCMPVTMKVLESTDQSWYSNLESTKWLTYVTSCLKVTVHMAQLMMGDLPAARKQYRRANIAIKEHDGARDMAAVLSSLVQILLDPYCRSFHGFQMLIEKEWVAMGHPFRDRLGLTSVPDDDEQQCPVFLLFLDCVYQLQRLRPRSFEFSEHYLTLLWDNVCSGLFQNFIFNCQHDRVFENEDLKRLSNFRSKHLLNVWDISKQFSMADFSIYRNPSYLSGLKGKGKLKGQDSIDGYSQMNSEHKTQQSVRILNKYSYYSQTPTDRVIALPPDEETASKEQHICPDICWSQTSFWSGCYLRWLTPIQIVSGGPPVEFILESILAERTYTLLKRIEQLEGAVNRTDVQLDTASFWSAQQSQLMNVTSSFPFLPERPTSQMYFFTMPMKMSSEEMMSSAEFQSSVSSAGTDCSS